MSNSFEKKTAEIENLLKAIRENKPVNDIKPGQGIIPDLPEELLQVVKADEPLPSDNLIKEIDDLLNGNTSSVSPEDNRHLFTLDPDELSDNDLSNNEKDPVITYDLPDLSSESKTVFFETPLNMSDDDPVDDGSANFNNPTGNTDIMYSKAAAEEDSDHISDFSNNDTSQDDIFGDLSFDDTFQIDSNFFSFEEDSETAEDIPDDLLEEVFEEPIEEIENDLRSFFGKTIVIDESLEKNNDISKKDIRNFVGRDKTGGTLYSGDETEDFIEYQSEEDTEQLYSELKKYSFGYLCRLVISTLLFIASLIISHRFGSFYLGNKEYSLFCYITAGILAAGFAVNFNDLISDLGKILSFKKGSHSLQSILYIAAISGMIVKGIYKTDHILISFSVIPLLASIAGNIVLFLNARRIFKNFNKYSEKELKTISGFIEDESLSIRLMRSFSPSSVNVLVRSETEFADGFLENSFSESSIGEGVGRILSFMFLISLGIGAAAFYKTDEIFISVQAFITAVALISPISSMWCRLFPIIRLQWHLSKFDTVVPGYSTCEELRQSNSVILDGREIFPEGNVKLTGIKTFDKEPIDKAIIYAASVLSFSESTIADVFLKVIQNDTEMLLDVDGVEYEKGLGYSYWAENKRILLGTRALMQTHEIDIPSLDFEKKYTKKDNRRAVYLSVSGRLFAMFVVSYSPNINVRNNIISLLNRGVNILVKTRDFNITGSSISLVYRIPERYISVMNETGNSEIDELIDNTSHRDALIVGSNSFDSFCHTISAAFNIKGIASMMSSIELIGLIIALLFSAIILLFGSFTNVAAISVISFQMIWFILPVVTAWIRKI